MTLAGLRTPKRSPHTCGQRLNRALDAGLKLRCRTAGTQILFTFVFYRTLDCKRLFPF
jgi:hypothetical protein